MREPAPARLLTPPVDLGRRGAYRFGRFSGPVATPTIDARGAERFRLKEWQYLALTHPRFFIAMAVVQLGYLANCFAYVVDRSAPARRLELDALSPLGRALRMAPSSVRGASVWRRRGELLRMRYDQAFVLEVDLPLGDVRLTGSARIGSAPGLSISFPLGPDRPAYTHKAVGLSVSGALRLGDEAIPLEEALGTVDFTRSLADRETRWNWCALSHRLPDGRPFGLNLSDHVYVDADGSSPENFFRVGERIVPLGAVRFSVPGAPAEDTWWIRSRDDDSVDLAFTPVGARRQSLDLRLLRSAFVQPYGTFRGRVADITLDEAFGVVEDHYAKW